MNLPVFEDALHEPSRLDERDGRIIDLRFLARLSIEETSEIPGISEATVSRKCTTARACLYGEGSHWTNP